jgi:prepilin-type N-terminal cleavage/methylation domain-containing protein
MMTPSMQLQVYYQKRKIMHKESGFTLAELMITIAIIVIMSSIVVPTFLSWLPKYRLRSAVTNLAADLQATKIRAIKENRNWSVFFSRTKNMYYICSDPGGNATWDGPVATGGDDILVRSINLRRYGSGVRITAPGANTALIFDTRGMANAVQIDLTNMSGSPSYRVQTTLSGGVLSDKL